MRARNLQPPNRAKDLLFCQGKHKVSQGYSPADENAGLAYALRDDVP
jgi:hypothetical protein